MIKGYVRKRTEYRTHPWRASVFPFYRDFETQPEAFRWAFWKVALHNNKDKP